MNYSRRDFLAQGMKLAGAGALAGLTGCSWLHSPSPARKAKNVLLIILDDMNTRLRCYGQPQVVSPNIDKLAAEGVLFTNTFCQYPVCNPSRLSLLTGLRPDSTHVYDNTTIWPPIDSAIASLPRYFKNHGYHTATIGKVYHQPVHTDLDAFSEKPQCLHTHNYMLKKNQDEIARITREETAAGKKWDEIMPRLLVAATEDADVPDDGYNEGKHASMAIEHLRKIRGQQRPFFLALGFFRPHMPFLAPKKYWDLYSRPDLRLADNPFPPRFGLPYPMHDNFEPKVYGDIPKSDLFSEEVQRRLLHGYYACVSYMDAQVGRVLDELDRLNLRDETIVVFLGDNGFHLGDHNLWGKFTTFEAAAHCPLVMRIPGLKHPGRRVDALTEFVDVYPTLCDHSGLPKPAHLEGTSLVSLVSHPARPWKSAAFTQFLKGNVMGYSMRTERHRYVEWVEWPNRKYLDAELYDYQHDPEENCNIAGQPGNRELVNRLREMLHAGWREALPQSVRG